MRVHRCGQGMVQGMVMSAGGHSEVNCGTWQGQTAAELLRARGHFVWEGESGRLFTHTIYSLYGCPAPTAASWVLVRRGEDGKPVPLATGATRGSVPSSNLAEIRRLGATLAAEEVHLRALEIDDDSDAEQLIASDVGSRAGVAFLRESCDALA